MRPVDVVLQK